MMIISRSLNSKMSCRNHASFIAISATVLFVLLELSLVHSSPVHSSSSSTSNKQDQSSVPASKSTTSLENEMILNDILMSAVRNGGATISLQRMQSQPSQQFQYQQQQPELQSQFESSDPSLTSSSGINSELLNRNYLNNLRILQQFAGRLPEQYQRTAISASVLPVSSESSSGFNRINSKRAAAMGVDLPDYILHINKGRNFDFSSFREKMQKSG